MKNPNILHKDYTLFGDNYQLKLPLELEREIVNDDCVRLISWIVEEMNLAPLMDTYERKPSEKLASPKIMLKIFLYAYHERIDTSSRIIEKRCTRDINYMYLLEGRKVPDHATIARFRSRHLAKCAQELLAELIRVLIGLGQITTSELFVDGTKIEADANRYTFVWKKRLMKHQKRHLQRTALLVGDIIQRYGFAELRDRQVRKRDVKKLLKKLVRKAKKDELVIVHGRGHRKEELQKDIEALAAALEKINGYDRDIHACGERNSYSKTDHDATFMHMKDDHMMNGQLKPGYNLQHAVNSGYIVGVNVYPNPTDVLTLIPFMKHVEETLGLHFERLVADAGYESEENLDYLERMNIQPYIKPANYEQVGTKKFEKQIGRHENMEYDAENDRYICHNGKFLEKTDEKISRSRRGYEKTVSTYRCADCNGCPYREKCCSGPNWKKPVDERFKSLSISRKFEAYRAEEYERIDSDEGKMLRMNRSIQAEGSFADIKGDSRFTRFLCRGNENVLAESILYAMAHNIGWLHSRIQNDCLNLHLYELKAAEKKAA